jgi:hypothetical protein
MCRNGRNVNEFIFGDFPAAIRRDFLCAPLEFSLHIYRNKTELLPLRGSDVIYCHAFIIHKYTLDNNNLDLIFLSRS